MKTYKKQTEQFDTFDKLIYALKTKYTLSFKQACKQLKCSRSWAQQYIRPNIPCVYLPNGKGTSSANYAKIASLRLNDNILSYGHYSNESIYLDESAFNTFIHDSIVSCTKRSKCAYRTYFIDEKFLYKYYSDMLSLYHKKAYSKMNDLYLSYAKNDYVKSIIHNSIVYQNKRSVAPFIDVPIPATPIKNWNAVHDLMDYGDTEEPIYRKLFCNGCIRVEIILPDKNGVIKNSGKIYYIDDPEPIKQPDTASVINKILSNYPNDKKDEIQKVLNQIIKLDQINITQNSWIKYNNMLGNTITY